MIKKQTVKLVILSFLMLFVGLFALTADPVSAANNCGVETAILDCGSGVTNSGDDISNYGVWSIVLIAINILTALVGVAVLGGIIYGAVLYTTAQGDQGKVKKAIEVITNVVIGFLAYALMFAGLNFLIPGGVFN